jgi:hypothetical protein
VTASDGDEWSVEARFADTAPDLNASDSSLSVDAEDVAIFGINDARQEWDVVLPRETRMDLTIEANAASSDLELEGTDMSALAVDANAGDSHLVLGGASVDELSVDANAGSISIITDADTRLAGSVEMNAGSLDLCIPDGVVFAITLEDGNITFTHNLDDSGLIRQGDTWVTGDDAVPTLTLRVEGNAATFTLNPEDGCR